MPDRTVSYSFRANFSQFTAGLAAMGKSVEATGAKLTALDRNGQKMRSGLTSVGNTAGKIGLVVAAGVAGAVVAAANFEQAMADVSAATHETSGNMALLRQAALDAGQATKYSATEAAGAIEELAKAGVSTKDILAGGLTGSLNLAAAGGLAVADAAEIAASALVQFKLSGDQVPHVADLLAAGAGKAQGSVQDLGYALKYAGVPAASLGVSIEETTGTLAEFASAGIVGEQAGTTLRSLLLSLAAPTAKASATMDQYGISLYDANGKFVGIQDAAEQLHVQLAGLSEAQRNAALNTIFGTNAIQGAIQLYNGGGAAIADWTKKVNDQGYAADTAAIKMDTLKGDVEQLKGALETAFIGAGSGSQGPLRSLVQGITSAVNAFNKLPPAAQHSVTALGGIVAVTGGALFFGAKVVNGISDAREALENLGVSADKTKGLLAGVGKAAGAAGLLIAGLALVDKFNPDKAFPGLQELTGDLIQLSKADTSSLPKQFDDLSSSIERLANPNAAQSLQDKLSGALGGIGGGSELRNAQKEIEALDNALTNLVSSGSPDQAKAAFAAIADSAGLSKSQLADFTSLLPNYKDALAGAANQSDLAAGSNDDLAIAQASSAQAAKEQADAIAEATKEMQDQTNAALDAFDAQTQYRQAVKDATAQSRKSQDGIRGNSDAALANRNALSQLASAWNNQSSVVKDNVGQFRQARATFIATAQAMGVPKKAAQQLANTLLQIPQSRVTNVQVNGVESGIQKAQTLKQVLDSLHSKSLSVALHYQTIGNKPSVLNNADGGEIGGPREPYGDKVLSWLAPGEQVISNRYGQADRFRADMAAGRIPGYADGGTVPGGGAFTDDASGPRKQINIAGPLAAFAAGVSFAGRSLKALKHQLDDLEHKVKKLGTSADNAHNALDGLKGQRDSLASSVSDSLSAGDPFRQLETSNAFSSSASGGLLSQFSSTVAATDANATKMLAALQTIVANGIDPKGAFFQQLAASGNVPLAEQFASLTRASLANYAASFGSALTAQTTVGTFAGDQSFGDAIKAQSKITASIDGRLKEANQRLNQLEAAIKHKEAADAKSRKDAADRTGDKVNGAAGKGHSRGKRKG